MSSGSFPSSNFARACAAAALIAWVSPVIIVVGVASPHPETPPSVLMRTKRYSPSLITPMAIRNGAIIGIFA
jgi:hypothetical protein